MPVCELDPWRMQYFEGLDCPEDVRIPTEDGDAYMWNPEHRWIYNKLMICETQGLPCAPHGFEPESYPVYSKPIYNMRGMGAGTQIFTCYKDYMLGQQPGHMWMELLEGEHVSTDIAVVDGEPQWWRHVTGLSLGDGLFDYWTVLAEHRPDIEAYCGDWLRQNFRGYTGMVNFETIGGKIIEGHMRFSDQWPDLYGDGWCDALVKLYRDGVWDFDDSDRVDGYSVVLFGAHGVAYSHPPAALVDRIRQRPDVSSVQITFHEDRPPEAHSMPPGGFRLAIVNCEDLAVGRAVRDELALSFWSKHDLGDRRAATGRV